MSATLERRYARMLNLYPGAWREEHGRAIVGTLLDLAAAEGRTAPTARERLDLAMHGLFARLNVVLPACVRDGVAAVAIATGTAFALIYFWFSGWAPLMRNRDFYRESYAFGPFMNPGVILCGLWVVVFLCVLCAWNRAAKVALITVIITAIALPWINQPVPAWDGPSSTNLGFLAILATLGLIGTPRSRPRLARAGASWLIALFGLYAANDLLSGGGDRSFWSIIASPTNLALAGTVALMIAVILLGLRRRTAAAVLLWSLLPWLAAFAVGIAIDDPATGFYALVIIVATVVFLAAAAYAFRRAGVVIRIVIKEAE